MGFFDKDDEKRIDKETVEDGRLLLREEQLDIAKDRIKTGEVNLRKEIIEEQKIVDVPITREEVVIERRALNNELSDTPIGEEETIHIPVTEEQIEVGKHTVITGEVLASKREVEETRHVDETIKREEARVDVDGDPNIVHDDFR